MIYQYECQDCGNEFEVTASLAEKEAGLEPHCPNCRSDKTEQTFRGVGLLVNKGGVPPRFSGGGCGPMCGPGTC